MIINKRLIEIKCKLFRSYYLFMHGNSIPSLFSTAQVEVFHLFDLVKKKSSLFLSCEKKIHFSFHVKKIHFSFRVKKKTVLAHFYFLQKATSTARGWPSCPWMASRRASPFRPWPATAMASSPRRGTAGSLPRPSRPRWAMALEQDFLLVEGNSLFLVFGIKSSYWSIRTLCFQLESRV